MLLLLEWMELWKTVCWYGRHQRCVLERGPVGPVHTYNRNHARPTNPRRCQCLYLLSVSNEVTTSMRKNERRTYMAVSVTALLSLGHSFIHLRTFGPLARSSLQIHSTTLRRSQEPATDPPWIPMDTFIDKLDSYSSNIARTRKNHNMDTHVEHHTASTAAHFINAVQSLYFTLKNQQAAMQNQRRIQNTHLSMTIDQRDHLEKSLRNTLIQTVRGLADMGDYALLLKLLLDAVIPFATHFSKTYTITDTNDTIGENVHILHPRIFGEALVGLGQRTLCSTSKLKKLWNAFTLYYSQQDLLFITPPSAVELTAMMTGLARRGKVKAALQLFYSMTRSHIEDESNETDNHHTSLIIPPDSYAICELLRILADSIQPTTLLKKLELDHSTDIDTDTETNDTQQTNDQPQHEDYDSSPCWQWRETIHILNWVEAQHPHSLSNPLLNNHVYSAALKVNEQAHLCYGMQKHKGALFAVSLLDRMKRTHISPDVITISTILSTLDKSYLWKDAVELLESMEQVAISQHWTVRQKEEDDQETPSSHSWTLPFPNIYTYSAAISSCARCGQFDQAQSILERMRQWSKDGYITPNTWVYNSVLSACLRDGDTKQGRVSQGHQHSSLNTALRMLQYMEEDGSKGHTTAPDIVTYNTILALMGGLAMHCPPSNDSSIPSSQKSSTLLHSQPTSIGISQILRTAQENREESILKLLDDMVDKGIERNEITYRNALMASRGELQGMTRIFCKILMDMQPLQVTSDEMTKWSRTAEKATLANLALSFCASSSNLSDMVAIFEIMRREKIPADTDSMSHLINALYSTRLTEESIWMLNAMKGDAVANQHFAEKTNIDISASGISIPMVEEEHYSTAIIGCLNTGEMFLAQKILAGMKIHGLVPKDEYLEEIILAYCKLAINASSKEFSDARMEKLNNEEKETLLKPSHQISKARAIAALNMMKSLTHPSLQVQTSVAQALAASGSHTHARLIVRSLQDLVVEEMMAMTLYGRPVTKANSRLLKEVPKLHKSLLKLCARSGNITAALWYADDIQQMSNEIVRKSLKEKPSVMLDDPNISLSSLPPGVDFPIGMSGEDWKLVTIAASKAGHWKICVKSLQFLRPHVEATNPTRALSHHSSTPNNTTTRKEQDTRYENLSRALTAALLAFEMSGQYAWGVRAINDWIEWSGSIRRPQKEAVFSLCRILAARSQGAHVVALIQQILQIPSSSYEHYSKTSKKVNYSTSYESAIYSQAIVALVQNGLYDNADELYAAAVAGGFLPFALVRKEPNEKFYQLDLHGMSSAIAHSAVRVSLQHLIQTSGSQPISHDVLIVTGRGRGSARWLRPVLRPEVQRMLVEEFYPPISTVSMPRNMGALLVSAADVNQWMNYQQEQKGKRLLTVAEILKSFTSGSRLSRALSLLQP